MESTERGALIVVEGADMTSRTRRAADTQALEDRRDRALESLAQRASVEVPAIRSPDGPRPLSGADYLLGGLAMDTFLVEMVAALAAQVEALKAEVAMVCDDQVSPS
jgi:hypothetical protein